MKGVDLNLYKFDYDLTFAVILMNADSTIYHQYGGRDHISPTSYVSIDSLIKLMKDTLEDHVVYSKKPSPPKELEKRTVEQIPPMAKRLKEKKLDCIHCHMVFESEREYAQKEKKWSRDNLWKWPLPNQIGIKLDSEDQTLVKEIDKGSSADNSSLSKGDRIVKFGDQNLRTITDIQSVLDGIKNEDTTIKIEYERDGKKQSTELKLSKGWKTTDPLPYSWRAHMWGISPQTGFGGPRLKKDELKKIGLDENAFAFKINYIVDWDENAKYGNNAKKAGLRKGDVVISINGKKDFESEMHFQTWFRLTLKPGDTAEIEILRDSKSKTIKLTVIE